MKKLALIAAVVALCACSQEAKEPANTGAIETPAPAETTAMDDPAGTYDVKRYNGGNGTTIIKPDGTYTDTGPDGTTKSGTFARKDGKWCFDSEGDEPEVCWTISEPGADGSFNATDPKGHTVTARRRAEAKAPAPAETTTK